MRSAVRQLRSVFEHIQLDAAMFNASPFTRLSELRHLQHTEQLDSHLRWTPIPEFVPGANALSLVGG